MPLDRTYFKAAVREFPSAPGSFLPGAFERVPVTGEGTNLERPISRSISLSTAWGCYLIERQRPTHSARTAGRGPARSTHPGKARLRRLSLSYWCQFSGYGVAAVGWQ